MSDSATAHGRHERQDLHEGQDRRGQPYGQEVSGDAHDATYDATSDAISDATYDVVVVHHRNARADTVAQQSVVVP